MYIKKYHKETFLSFHHKKLRILKKEILLNNNKKNIIRREISKNLKKIINYIDTKYNGKLIHISSKRIEYEDLYNTNYINRSLLRNSKIYYNPHGLWVSCGSSWLRWIYNVKNFKSRWANPRYIYVIDLKKNNNILKISNLKEMLEFHKKFSQLTENNYNINWKEVKKTYNGLIIDPYLGKNIWDFFNNKESNTFYLSNSINKYIHKTLGKNIKKYMQFYLEWYRHWETSSGVIWREKAIESIKQIL